MEAGTTQQHTIIVLTCADCGATLRERFDHGSMTCDRCGREIPVAEILAALRDLETAMRPGIK
jgi:ribosomal protein L37AE/L43A